MRLSDSGSSTDNATRANKKPSYVVRGSGVHGKGVFASRKIGAGDCIIEYRGERITSDEAERRAEANNQPINHTYLFSLNDARVIDGGCRGNEARFINHACEPNCEAIEHEDGRVYIYSLCDIARGEELTYSYPLIYEGRHTPAIKRLFACRCGTPGCTGTYLAPKRPTKSR
jgi:SET domain-containing protein